HERRRVHRDVKPSNLLLSREGQVKILDLGLALLHEGTPPDEELTRTNQVMGTADYMAPEQASDPHHVDIRADLYSLGCTLFKLLTGAAPYLEAGHSKRRKMKAHAERPVPNMSAQRPEVPPLLAVLVQRLLAKNPAERPAEPADLAVSLTPFAAGSDLVRLVSQALQRAKGAGMEHAEGRETIAFSPPLVPPPLLTPTPRLEEFDSRPRRGRNRRRLLVGLGLLCAAVAIAVLIVLLRRNLGRNGLPDGATW